MAHRITSIDVDPTQIEYLVNSHLHFDHTSGHQSLRVQLESGDALLCGDACYMQQSLEAMQLPPTAHDGEQMLEFLRRIGTLEEGGVRFLFGHHPDLWRTLPRASAAIS